MKKRRQYVKIQFIFFIHKIHINSKQILFMVKLKQIILSGFRVSCKAEVGVGERINS
jgi:hypothetical protein